MWIYGHDFLGNHVLVAMPRYDARLVSRRVFAEAVMIFILIGSELSLTLDSSISKKGEDPAQSPGTFDAVISTRRMIVILDRNCLERIDTRQGDFPY